MTKKIFEREGIARIKYQDVGNYCTRNAFLHELNLVDLIQGNFEDKYIKITIEEYTCEDCTYCINDENNNYVACRADIDDPIPEWCTDRKNNY